MKIRLSAGIIVIFSIFSPLVTLASAHEYKKAVLGESVIASDVDVPAVVAGPGFLLPDSPLYFLDKSIQKIRLVLAFSPEQKAQVHDKVAQERLAEFRVMMAKNDSDGIITALSELTKENNAAAADLKEAAAKGKDVKKLAVQLNESMKSQRKLLNNTSAQAKGSLKLRMKAAKEELRSAKVDVEDQLDEDDILREVEETLNDDIEDDISDASESARKLEHSLDVLTELASEAAKKQQLKREEALRKAIEVKNEAVKREQERLLLKEKLKQEKMLRMKNEAAKEARETVKKARETAKKYDETKKEFEAMKREAEEKPVDTVINQSPSVTLPLQ